MQPIRIAKHEEEECKAVEQFAQHYNAVANFYYMRDMNKKAIQKVGDRDKPTISIKDYAFCVNANPMSDRQQFVVEYDDN